MPIDCLCCGILFADVICTPVDHVPEAGELVAADAIELSLGGCAANAALDLARLGVRVGVAGCVGDDTLGRFVVESLQRGGVETRGIRRIAGINTATTMVVNVRGQDRRFVSSPGANTRMTVEHVPPDWLREARVLYVGGYLMLPALETEAMGALLREARRRGTKTVVDVVYMGNPGPREALAKVLPATDVFLPNDDEGRILTGLDDPVAQAEAFRALGAETVVVTLGGKGSVLVGPRARLRAGVYPTEFVGGTGSGDAFDAGYIAGLLDGRDERGCLEWGSALGASCVRAIGATESVFDRGEAERFIAAHRLPIEPI